MLLKQLLDSPRTSSQLLVYDPFGELNRQDLVREVIGLANADVEGPRNILFGVNPTADGDGIVGISDSAAAELKKAHRLISRLIEPALDLAFIYDRINGKLVGALEIDGCEFGPYFVGDDFSDALLRGQCWVREERDLRAVERAQLKQNDSLVTDDKPGPLPEQVEVSVGFNDDPDCHYLEMPVLDTSNPPFDGEDENDNKPLTIAGVIKDTVGNVTTQIQRLRQGGAAKIEGASYATTTDLSEDAGKIFADAQNHYYFEERALKLDLCIRNRGEMTIRDATLELGFPRIPDFDVADRIYASPFDKRTASEVESKGYPHVESRQDAIFARSALESLPVGGAQPAFRSPLRLAVGPGMQGRKLGIRYTLRGPDGRALSKGNLKIRFGRIADGS